MSVSLHVGPCRIARTVKIQTWHTLKPDIAEVEPRIDETAIGQKLHDVGIISYRPFRHGR